MRDMVLVLNAGSSSLKFALFPLQDEPIAELTGAVERIGQDDCLATTKTGDASTKAKVVATDHSHALAHVADTIQKSVPDAAVTWVGHRIVHGGAKFTDPAVVSRAIVEDLRALMPLAPLHLPHGLMGIEVAEAIYPNARQIACFDTAFHANKPWVHNTFALDRSMYDAGIRRYGFHGLSCQSIVRQLQSEGYPLSERKLVIAHLGNGCSATAVLNGKCHATSMGFSTLDGLVMGTRSGSIDPGVLVYWMHQGKTAHEIEKILYGQSGLLGVSERSNDMRDLLGSDDRQAQRAIEMFVARAVEEIARLAATMQGLDALVFCGGIGENAGVIRDRISGSLGFLSKNGLDIHVRQSREEAEIFLAVRANEIGTAH